MLPLVKDKGMFKAKEKNMKKIWNAINDETRRKILSLLKKGDMTAGQVVEQFETSQPTISHHLSVLKDAGLIKSEKVAQSIVYSINTTVFQNFMISISELFSGCKHEKNKK